MKFEVDFFSNEHGRSPCREWMSDLPDHKLESLIAAIRAVLAESGISVCGTPYGKHLGQALAEFRVRRDTPTGPVLLRVFFHAHGQRQIILLSGYDKGADPSEKRQQKEIRRARGLLRDFRDQ